MPEEHSQQSGAGSGKKNFYLVDIDEFSGPLDLLLALVKKSEINIYDIPVSDISEQYRRHLELVRKHNLDSVGQYLPLLAELGLLKSRTLLPEPEEDTEEDGIDPRLKLARQLANLERFKNVAMSMGDMNLLGRDVFKRGGGYEEEFGDPEFETEIVKTDVWSLIKSLCEMRARLAEDEETEIHIGIEPISIEKRLAEIRETLRGKGVIEDFRMLFDENPSKGQVAVSFLAVLELAKKGVVNLFQKKPFSSIKLLYSEEENEGNKKDN